MDQDPSMISRSRKARPRLVAAIERTLQPMFQRLPVSVDAVLLYGSLIKSNSWTPQSDIDLCIVASQEKERAKLVLRLYELLHNYSLHNRETPIEYDLHLFEDLPLYIQIRIIEKNIPLFVRNGDLGGLYEYFYSYRKRWEEQKERNSLSKKELLSFLNT